MSADKDIEAAIAEGMAKAYQLGFHEGIGTAAILATNEAERIKHTSHLDGIGMGSLCCEQACHRVAASIFARGSK